MGDINFFHIPKNGGQSIQQLIMANDLQNINYNFHSVDPFLFKPEDSMVILRDPIDRFISAFYYSKQCYPDCKLSIRVDIDTPSKLIKNLIDEGDYLISSPHHNIGDKILGISWVWCPQYYWYNNPKYVLLFDNLEKDLNKFLEETKQPSIKMPHQNSSIRPKITLSISDIDYIHSKYHRDYEIINNLR